MPTYAIPPEPITGQAELFRHTRDVRYEPGAHCKLPIHLRFRMLPERPTILGRLLSRLLNV